MVDMPIRASRAKLMRDLLLNFVLLLSYEFKEEEDIIDL